MNLIGQKEEPREKSKFSEERLDVSERQDLERDDWKSEEEDLDLPRPSYDGDCRLNNPDEKGTETKDPFEEPNPSLLVVYGAINGIRAKILIDSGATLNHISRKFCEKHGIQLRKEENRIAIMANESKEAVDSTENTVSVSIKGYTESMRLVANIQRFDLILGKKWMTNHHAVIDCHTNQMNFLFKGKTHHVFAKGEQKMEEISLNNMIQDVKNGCQVFAVMLDTQNSKKDDESPGYHKDITKLIGDFKDVFPEALPKGLPPSRIKGDFRIKLKEGSQPVKRKLYRMSQSELEELKEKIEELLDQGFIRPSSSPWAAPVLFVSKKDGGLRFCVDYRGLNKLTVKNSYPLPRIDEILDQLSTAKYFSVIDLRSGYHQMRIAEEDVPMTAFSSKFGHFEFTVVPFGLTNAPASFMSMMDKVLADYTGKFVMAYLDDILVYSESWDAHIEHLQKVLNKLRLHKLYAKLTKCEFGLKEVEYLGFIIRSGTLDMKKSKIEAINAWKSPESKKELQSFLGLVNYYRRFIRNFAKIAKPLTDLTKKVPFIWTECTHDAFLALKNAVITAPVIHQFSPDKPIFITTDASKDAIGAVMEQEFEDGKHPVCFASRVLNSAEQNYAAHDLELLGIVDTIRAWRYYLHGRKFTVFTDHHPLRYLETQEHLSPRQVRWLERLAQFNFEIIPIKGKSNVVADALSRQRNGSSEEQKKYSSDLLKTVMTKTTLVNSISSLNLSDLFIEDLRKEYLTDKEFKYHFVKPSGHYKKQDGLLYFKDKICIPNGETRCKLLHDYHSTPIAGHLGKQRLIIE